MCARRAGGRHLGSTAQGNPIVRLQAQGPDLFSAAGKDAGGASLLTGPGSPQDAGGFAQLLRPGGPHKDSQMALSVPGAAGRIAGVALAVRTYLH